MTTAAVEERCCTWTEDGDDWESDGWDTACGERFVFIEGGPEDNRIRFCCYCGGKLVAVKHQQATEVSGSDGKDRDALYGEYM